MAFTPFTEDDRPTMAAFNQKFQDAILSAFDMGVQFVSGKYTGTGTSGTSAKTSITFPSTPLFVVIAPYTAEGRIGFWLGGEIVVTLNSAAKNNQQDSFYAFSCTASLSQDNTLSWYGRSIGTIVGGPDSQLNKSGVEYTYIALCKGSENT